MNVVWHLWNFSTYDLALAEEFAPLLASCELEVVVRPPEKDLTGQQRPAFCYATVKNCPAIEARWGTNWHMYVSLWLRKRYNTGDCSPQILTIDLLNKIIAWAKDGAK